MSRESLHICLCSNGTCSPLLVRWWKWSRQPFQTLCANGTFCSPRPTEKHATINKERIKQIDKQVKKQTGRQVDWFGLTDRRSDRQALWLAGRQANWIRRTDWSRQTDRQTIHWCRLYTHGLRSPKGQDNSEVFLTRQTESSTVLYFAFILTLAVVALLFNSS